jgi:hypothetical protein
VVVAVAVEGAPVGEGEEDGKAAQLIAWRCSLELVAACRDWVLGLARSSGTPVGLYPRYPRPPRRSALPNTMAGRQVPPSSGPPLFDPAIEMGTRIAADLADERGSNRESEDPKHPRFGRGIAYRVFTSLAGSHPVSSPRSSWHYARSSDLPRSTASHSSPYFAALAGPMP